MSKHTPGPWVKDYGGSRGHIKSLWKGHKIVPAGRCTPTVCQYQLEEIIIPKEQQDANARLIAAAPDLLEALEQMIDLCASMESLDRYGEAGPYLKAQAAIAKARGTNNDQG